MNGDGGHVLIVSDEPLRASALASVLTEDALTVRVVDEVASACAQLRSGRFGVVVADLRSADFSSVAVLRCAAAAQPPARVICVFGTPGSSRTTRLAIREAAFACLDREAGVEGVRAQVQAALDAQLALVGMYETAGGSHATAGTRSPEGGRGAQWR